MKEDVIQSHVTTPQGHVTTPQGHVTTPQDHVTTPQGHVTTPQDHVTTPQGDVVTPQPAVEPEPVKEEPKGPRPIASIPVPGTCMYIHIMYSRAGDLEGAHFLIIDTGIQNKWKSCNHAAHDPQVGTVSVDVKLFRRFYFCI